MKKTLLITLILLLTFSLTVTAQTGVGFGAGLNSSTVKIDDTNLQNFNCLMGMNAGLVLDRALNGPLSLQMGIFYSQIGGKYHEKITEGTYSSEENVTARGNYLFIPLTAKYDYKISDCLTAYGILGGYFAARINGSVEGTIRDNSGWSMDIDVDIDDQAKKTDAGLVIGAGVQTKLGSHTVYAEVKWAMGLTNAYQPGESLAMTDLTATSSVFMLTIGVLNLLRLPF